MSKLQDGPRNTGLTSDLAGYLKGLIVAKRTSQRALSLALGVSTSQLNRILNDKEKLPLYLIEHLAEVLMLDIQERECLRAVWDHAYLTEAIRSKLSRRESIDVEEFVSTYLSKTLANLQLNQDVLSCRAFLRVQNKLLSSFLFWLNMMLQIEAGNVAAEEIMSPNNTPLHLRAPNAEAGAGFIATLEQLKYHGGDRKTAGLWSEIVTRELSRSTAKRDLKTPAIVRTHADYLFATAGIHRRSIARESNMSLEEKRRMLRGQLSGLSNDRDVAARIERLFSDKTLTQYFILFELWHSGSMTGLLGAAATARDGHDPGSTRDDTKTIFQLRCEGAKSAGSRAVFALAAHMADAIPILDVIDMSNRGLRDQIMARLSERTLNSVVKESR